MHLHMRYSRWFYDLVITVVIVVRYCVCEWLFFVVPPLLWAPSGSQSSSLIPLTVNDSIKGLTEYRQAALHHSLLCWNELWICLFKVKGLHGQWWDRTAGLSPETNGSQHTSFSCLFLYYWDFLHIWQPSIIVIAAYIYFMSISLTVPTSWQCSAMVPIL